MRLRKLQNVESIIYFYCLFAIICLIVSTPQAYLLSNIDAWINTDFNDSRDYNYDLYREPGNQEYLVFPDILENYSPPNAAIVHLEDLEKNSSGFFGRIVIIDEFSMSAIPENRTSIQNFTNLLFWKYDYLESWRNYTEFYNNKTINAVFHTVSLDILRGELFEIREYPSNITEHIFVDTINGVTTRIEWHNTNLFPSDRNIDERLSYENSIILDLRQDNDSDQMNRTNFPIITVAIILGTNGVFLFLFIKRLNIRIH